jgi:voltage-gated potassium channel Kch
LRQISTLTTTAGVGTTFTASAGTTRVSIKYEADSLPVNSVITVYLHGDLSQSAALLDPSANILLSVVVAWLATDSTVPTATTPLTVTINNPGIAIGAQVYTHSGNTLTLAGTATVGGQVVLSISDDPEIFVANPIKSVSKKVNNRKVFVRKNAPVMKALVLSNRSKYCSHFA